MQIPEKFYGFILTLLLSACGGGGGSGGSSTPPVEPADVTPPAIVSRQPATGATGVDPSAPILIGFNERIQLASNGYSLTVGGQLVQTTFQINTSMLTITPTNAAALSGEARLRLSAVRDLSGNHMAEATLAWQLREVNPPEDTTPPTILSRVPAANATGVDPSAPIVITFDESVQLTSDSFSLTAGGQSVANTFEISAATLTIRPTNAAALSGVAALQLISVRDVTGNVMAPTTLNWTLREPAPVFGLNERPSNTTCLAPAPVSSGGATTIAWQPAFPNLANLNLPTAMWQMPGIDTSWYVLQQPGTVVRFNNDVAATTSAQVLDLTDRVSFGGWQGDETGLLGVATHPQFTSNRFLFLYYSARRSGGGLETRVARYTVGLDGSIDRNSETIVLRINRPNANHLGGQLAFGNDGYLYIGSGDGGGSGDPDRNGQNTNTLLGKVLRIDVDRTSGSLAYAIPASNPFASGGGAPEVYAYGLRNPWRFSFDKQSGDLWVGDVGQSSWEELNLVANGGNYGWSDMEGNACFRQGCSTAGKTLPIRAISHNSGACSVIGGFVYRGTRYPSAVGTYVYTDFCENTMRSLKPSGSGFQDGSHGSVPAMIASFAQDNNGELFAIGHASGTGTQIYKMAVSGGTTTPGVMASQLSQTGCVNPSSPTQAATGMIPFAVNSALWSDGVAKQRFLSLPDNTQVSVAADGDFLFPTGAVLMKHFIHNNRFIETRLLAKSELGWQGFSYEWRDDQSDALLLPDAKDKVVDGLAWHYPSRGQCLSCHTVAANASLGAESKQLNGLTQYPNGNMANQLATLEHISVFQSPLSDAQKSTKLFALADSQATVAQKARSYLHSNCSGCHRPGGPTPVNMDLQFSTNLSQMRVCDVLPSAGDLSIPNARIVALGSPERSVLLARMKSLDHNRMPPIGSLVEDVQATEIVRQWIASLSSCTP